MKGNNIDQGRFWKLLLKLIINYYSIVLKRE
jgi:hypothetical protein